MDSSTPDPKGSEYAALKDLWVRVRELREAVSANMIAYYKPIGKQAEFHSSDTAQVRLVMGGNRSGKTTSGVIEAIAHSLGERPWLPEDHENRRVRLCNGDPIPVPNIGRVVVENFEVNVKQTLHQKMLEWAPKSAIKKVLTNPRGVPIEYQFANGSVIYVLSYEQDDEAFEGPNGHWAWCDEPPPQRKFNGLRRGLVDFDGHIWLTMTPLTEPWINEVLWSKANNAGSHIRGWTYDIWDNCVENGGYLSRRAIQSFLEDLPAQERAAREHGRPLHLAGLVFPEWQPNPPFWIDPFPIPSHWPRVELCDPHPRKPIAIMWAALSPDNVWYIYRELFDPELRTVRDVGDAIRDMEGWNIEGERYDWQLHEMMPVYRRGIGTEQIALRIIDTSANEQERTSGDTVADQFGRLGLYHVDAYKRNRDAGLNAIHTALQLRTEWAKPGLVVFNTCPTIKKNFTSYVWDRWGNSRQSALKGEKQDVVKWNDDFIDLIRYMFQMQLSYSMLRSNAFRAKESDAGDDRDNSFLTLRRGSSGRRYTSPAKR